MGLFSSNTALRKVRLNDNKIEALPAEGVFNPDGGLNETPPASPPAPLFCLILRAHPLRVLWTASEAAHISCNTRLRVVHVS